MSKPQVTLLLAYEKGSRALPLARIDDSAFIATAARRALADKRHEARQLARADRVLGINARGEVKRLEETLKVLIPGLANETSARSARVREAS